MLTWNRRDILSVYGKSSESYVNQNFIERIETNSPDVIPALHVQKKIIVKKQDIAYLEYYYGIISRRPLNS